MRATTITGKRGAVTMKDISGKSNEAETAPAAAIMALKYALAPGLSKQRPKCHAKEKKRRNI